MLIGHHVINHEFQPVDAADESFWEQFWSESVTNVQDVFALVPGAEIRALREESPNNLATLVYKAVEKLVKIVDSSCRTQREQQSGTLILINYIYYDTSEFPNLTGCTY